MPEPSRAGWFGLPPERRFCAFCGEKVVLQQPGGLWHSDWHGLVFHARHWAPWFDTRRQT